MQTSCHHNNNDVTLFATLSTQLMTDKFEPLSVLQRRPATRARVAGIYQGLRGSLREPLRSASPPLPRSLRPPGEGIAAAQRHRPRHASWARPTLGQARTAAAARDQLGAGPIVRLFRCTAALRDLTRYAVQRNTGYPTRVWQGNASAPPRAYPRHVGCHLACQPSHPPRPPLVGGAPAAAYGRVFNALARLKPARTGLHALFLPPAAASLPPPLGSTLTPAALPPAPGTEYACSGVRGGLAIPPSTSS